MIERFYDPTAGTVKFMGENVANLDNKWYHQKQLAIVQQEPILFSGSIRDNILYGYDTKGLTEDQV